MSDTGEHAEGMPHRDPSPSWFNALHSEVRLIREELQDLQQKIELLHSKRDPDRLLDVDEAAELASVSRRKLETLIHAGEAPSLKIGRRRLVPYRAFVAWLRSKAE